jgi:hypothetical protein
LPSLQSHPTTKTNISVLVKMLTVLVTHSSKQCCAVCLSKRETFFISVQFRFIFNSIIYNKSRGSSVSIVSDYGLDDRAIGVRYLAGTKDFSSNLCVQTGSETHPASCTMGTGGLFPGAKCR